MFAPLRYIVASTVLACLLLVACSGDESPSPTPSPTSATTEPPTVEPSATGSPGALGDLPPDLVVSSPGIWQRDELEAGDEIPDVLGAFIFDAGTGTGTLWSLDPSAVPDPYLEIVDTTPNGNFVVAANYIVNTATGQSFTLGPRATVLTVDDRGLALFQGAGCQFWAVDLSGSQPTPLAAFELPGDRSCNVGARFSPDASELLAVVQSANFSGGAMLYAVDLSTGEPAEIAQLAPTYITFQGREAATSVFLTGAMPAKAWVGEYVWADHTLSTVSIDTRAASRGVDAGPPDPGNLRVSPDGRWVAWSDSDDLGLGFGAGGEAEWPVVVIASLEEAVPAVRAQRVAMTNGIVTFDWIADSSALVVQSEDGFALLSPDGGLKSLPFPVASHGDPVPVPAPNLAGRFAYDGRIVDDEGADVGDSPAVAEAWGAGSTPEARAWWIRTRYGWGATGDRLLLVRTEVPGGDFGRGGVASLGLPPRVLIGEAAARPGPIRLRITSDGDPLNVRAEPGTNSDVQGQLSDGAVVTLSRDTDISHCGERGCSVLNDPDLPYGDGWWLFVKVDSGLAGWVSSEFVSWAD